VLGGGWSPEMAKPPQAAEDRGDTAESMQATPVAIR